MRLLKYPLAAALLFVPHFIFASEQLPFSVYLDVAGLTRAGAPRVVGDYAVFTFPPRSGVRFVGIAFASENFRTVHTFYRNANGVFFYADPLPVHATTIVYRLVVDGLWRSDPENPNTLTDPTGVVLSKLEVPPRRIPITASPVVGPGGSVQFFFKAPPGRIVTVAGDFNHWNPFADQLNRLPNGYYTTTLRLAPGAHAYYFIANGMQFPDPLNPRIDYRPDGTEISVFTVP